MSDFQLTFTSLFHGNHLINKILVNYSINEVLLICMCRKQILRSANDCFISVKFSGISIYVTTCLFVPLARLLLWPFSTAFFFSTVKFTTPGTDVHSEKYFLKPNRRLQYKHHATRDILNYKHEAQLQ